ncbi:MAG: metal-sensing transcriptional repressor [Gemmatimonadaceae bacterium]|nr:metal-sensing transcriptional repressor [Caulobacter sp.]
MAHVVHETHPEIVNRLKRAEGHLRKTIAMIEAGRTCLDLAQQLHAIEKAVAAAKKTLIHDHIDHCLAHAAEDDPKGAAKAIDELKTITKYLIRTWTPRADCQG